MPSSTKRTLIIFAGSLVVSVEASLGAKAKGEDGQPLLCNARLGTVRAGGEAETGGALGSRRSWSPEDTRRDGQGAGICKHNLSARSLFASGTSCPH